MRKQIAIGACLFSLILVASCVGNVDFDTLKTQCDATLESNLSFADLDAMVEDEVIQIHGDLVLEGYVISSDKAGNFFNVLYLQDAPENPTMGIQVEIDYRESHLFYPEGHKVFVKLKDLYLGKSGDNVKLGGTFTSFGNISVGRLPGLKVLEHIFLACDESSMVQPVKTTIPEIENAPWNTLVQIDSLEFVEEELGEFYAIATEETERRLKDCAENEIVMLNSGYADFQAELLPENNGSVTGVLIKDGKNRQLVIRGLEDLDFSNDRCPEIITEFTSTQIFISELADPDNNSSARFVELYNSAAEPLDLNLWTLRRYTNDNTEVSSAIDLSGFIIGAQSTLVISPNAEEFELVYGFPPDLGVSTNSPADSNGDDNLELVDPFGKVIDMFGVIGEDGSGTNHEFEDGRTIRNPNVVEGNPVYTFSEWIMYNDSGDAGTIQQPQNAPEDFSPGTRD
ncbi:lamin tail domain-containing protein [Muricauda sp. CAU 1633]|uniref:DUF5689 domain-containing protein n=1 Tax=Allomuricauda sp. CAU 1633 TaxID=2816036 RepID=UPI001A8CD071|nr:DUF5689 domain-containing protein [Muricauda sp. CAU 1633]MBO0321217.1 lamin tail domain-containing protein [Muricauda sp. CAU 1633]